MPREAVLVDTGPLVALYNDRDQEIDFADACLLHLSERESIETILTLDRRHFSVLRKLDGSVLSMLPDLP